MKLYTTTFVIVGIIFTLSGIILSFLWPTVYTAILNSELPLTPKSRVYDVWKDTSKVPITIEFYFFNWTNPEELKIPGKKPNFIEVGPYTFDEIREKVNITFHPENHTVSYNQRRFWYFNAEKSSGTLNDKMVQLNVVAVSAIHRTRFWSYFMQNSLAAIVKQFSKVHVVKTVDELLFKGYSDPLITMGRSLGMVDEVPFDRFGWFYMRNGSTELDGHYNMGTGIDSLSKLGLLKNWNYKDTTTYYKSPCNAVEGNVGEMLPPNRNFDDITIWAPELCRPITYEYTGTVTHNGILSYKYEVSEKALGNSSIRRYPHDQAKYFERTTTTEAFFDAVHSTTESEENLDDPDVVNIGNCYCNGECSPSGLANVTACRYGAPGFISLPHFYKADPILREQVTGLNPNERYHSSYVMLEPNTGVPLEVAGRFQINFLIQPSLYVDIFKDIPKMYFPILWFNLKGGITEELSGNLRQLLILPSAGLYGSIILAIVGAVVLMVLAIFQYSRSGMNLRMCGQQKIVASDSKNTEAIYMDTTITDDEHNKTDRPLQLKSHTKNL